MVLWISHFDSFDFRFTAFSTFDTLSFAWAAFLVRILCASSSFPGYFGGLNILLIYCGSRGLFQPLAFLAQ